MTKLKVPLLILLTMILLVVCASLPAIAASVQDSATVNNSGYSEMASLKLDFSEKRQSLSIMGKLAMLDNMEAVNIDPSQASMTEDEVFAAVEALMKDYEDAGIFQWFDFDIRWAVPKLCIDLNDANNFLVCWTVTYVNNDNPDVSLNLDIDDETGKILCLSYAVYDTYTMNGVWKRNKTVIDKFTDIYFSQLGLTESAEYAQSIEAGYELFEIDGGVSYARYSFGDVNYGEINLDFYAEGAGGFYLNFPFIPK